MSTRYHCNDCQERFAEPDYGSATSGSFIDPMACCPHCRSEDISAERIPSIEEIQDEQDAAGAAFAEFHALPDDKRAQLLAAAEARLDALHALRDRTTLDALSTLRVMNAQSLRDEQLTVENYRLLNLALDGIVELARGVVPCGNQVRQ